MSVLTVSEKPNKNISAISTLKDLSDNRRFWGKKSLFSDKGLRTNNIILKDKNRLATNSLIIANLITILLILQTP